MGYLKFDILTRLFFILVMVTSISVKGQEGGDSKIQELNYGGCWVRGHQKIPHFKGASFFDGRTYELSGYQFSQFLEEIESQVSQYNYSLKGSDYSTFVHCSSNLSLVVRLQIKDGPGLCVWGRWSAQGVLSPQKINAVTSTEKKDSPCFGLTPGKILISFSEEERDLISEVLESEKNEIISELDFQEESGTLFLNEDFMYREEHGKKELEKLLSSHGLSSFSLHLNYHYQLNGEFSMLPSFSKRKQGKKIRNSVFR